MMDELQGLTEEQIRIIEKSRQRVIESVGKNMDLYGVTHSIGHLYGHMYFYNNPVTLDEMSQILGMSKTSMSTGMRTLMDLKMVHKVWEKGARKDLYVVEPDWHQNFVDYFSVKWRKSLEMNVSALKKSHAELTRLLQNHSDDQQLQRVLELDIQKIEHAIGYYRWLERLIESFETGEIYDFIPKEPDPSEEK
jgi:HTH-type transcriptional regulator, glycine betaine synthesis regulator